MSRRKSSVQPITASMLYDLVQCPHRLHLDLHQDPARRDPESKFVQLLWEKGTIFEREVLDGLEVPLVDFGGESGAERERLTREAVESGADLICGGRIAADGLLGDPDLLRREGGLYVAGDIKSGAGEEGGGGEQRGRPKEHYAVQLALYTDILERLDASAGRRPFILDVHRQEVVYDLESPRGGRDPRRLWDVYLEARERAERIRDRKEYTRPALAGVCKLCHWRSLCLGMLRELDDLTLIPELGRAKRDALFERFKTVADLASVDIGLLTGAGKEAFGGVGARTLEKFHRRAILQKTPDARPYLKKACRFPESDRELFFDIETDPMRDICYLHGFLVREGGEGGPLQYRAFFAKTPDAEGEKAAFADAWSCVKGARPFAMYYYSKYERTWWYRLRERYPDVAAREEIERMFDPSFAVDLYYDVVLPCTEWPTRDYSIKTLASHLGFRWRDESPSGAESIEWYCRMVASGDPEERRSLLQRLLAYNEDDCRATLALLEGIKRLEHRFPGGLPEATKM